MGASGAVSGIGETAGTPYTAAVELKTMRADPGGEQGVEERDPADDVLA